MRSVIMGQSIKNGDNSKFPKVDMEALVKSAKEGNNEAMETILNKFNYFIMKHGAKYIIPSHEFEDLIQHGFLSIIKAVQLYKLGSNNFTTYCNNSIINNFKALLKGHIKHYREIQDESILGIQVYDFTLEDEVIAHEETKRAIAVLNSFPEEEKQIIYGVYIQDKTLKEVAATCNIKYRQAVELKRKELEKIRAAVRK
ncbi:MAG: polymerase sigma factor, sigma-70 family [Sedimentibacter sp.]|jgi:RNA polymerase sigma factor (sigma-70 family)|nr:polymerase sigma factor, sigma-70 family [Sedimentibacter sp.]